MTDELRAMYCDYRDAVELLARSNQTVIKRGIAIAVRDEFERKVRAGLLDSLFDRKD